MRVVSWLAAIAAADLCIIAPAARLPGCRAASTAKIPAVVQTASQTKTATATQTTTRRNFFIQLDVRGETRGGSGFRLVRLADQFVRGVPGR